MATVPEEAVIPLPPAPLAIAPFDKWEYEDVVREMREKTPSNYAVLKAYAVDKDHFRKGQEWVGPGTASANDKIEQQFAPEDAVGEVLSNISNAFSEPQIGAVPLEELPEGTDVPSELQQKIHELTTWLSNWWDTQRLQEHIQERQRTGSWAGYAGLRLWIPWRFLLKQGDLITIRPTSEIKEALDYIHIQAPMPDVGAVLIDAGTQDRCAVFMDEEVVYDAENTKHKFKRAELIYLDPVRTNDADADTIIRIVYADKKRRPLTARLRLGGRLLFSEMVTSPLLTDPVLRTQRQLNLLCTLVTRIGETAAFRERYTKNAKPQGLRVAYEDGEPLPNGAFLERDEEGRQWSVIPQERTLGANTTTELVGLPQYDEKGDQRGHQMPDVLIVDPVDPRPYIEAADATRRRILRMCSQGHLGGISNAEASGIAYEQARAVFEKDLNKRRVAEEGMLREILTAAIALAEEISGQVGYFTSVLRITVDQHIDAGPRSPDLVRLDLESYEAGGLSQETLMSRIGVEDINAEMVRVRRSAAYILEIIEKATAATETFTPESIIEVLRKLNVPKEIIDELKVKPEPDPVTPTPPPAGDA